MTDTQQAEVAEPEPIDIQLGGEVDDDGVYTAFARIPDPEETAEGSLVEPGSLPPLAEIRLTFHEDVDGTAVIALFQTFTMNVDDMIQRIDQARAEGEEG